MATVSRGPPALRKVYPAILCAVMLWPCVSPLKSTHQRAASHDSKHMGETDFEDCFNVFASYSAFHVADIEANIYILMTF